MENNQQAYVLNSNDYSIREFNSTLSKTFTRMFTGLLITALAAIITYGIDLFCCSVLLASCYCRNNYGVSFFFRV